jgi:hypothetical protein
MKRVPALFGIARPARKGPSVLLLETADGKMAVPFFETKKKALRFIRENQVRSDHVVGPQRVTERFLQALREFYLAGEVQYISLNPDTQKTLVISIPDFVIGLDRW